MKSLLRHFLFSLIALYLSFYLIKGVTYSGGLKTLLSAAVIFTLINLFVKPIVNLFMLPLNFLSLGLLSWLINVLMLYLLTLVLPTVKISSWQFPGFSGYGFIIPALNFSIFSTYILVSFLISLVIYFLTWLCQK